jgi:NADPH:quinone reductase-like Zn-dependent oxidoreductase
VPGHELSGVVAGLGYGTTGLTVGQRVFGLTDWARNGSLAEYTAVEARNLAPLPAGVDHTVAAALPISGLTAWQGLIDHARLTTGQTVLIHGAAGGVGSIAVQLARDVGAVVIGTGRAADRQAVLVPASPTSAAAWSTDGSDQSSARYAPSPKRPPGSPRTGALPERRSSGSSRAGSPTSSGPALTGDADSRTGG